MKIRMKSLKGAQPEIFRDRAGFLEQKHFDKHFMHDIQKKGSTWGKFSCLKDILKTAFQVRI